MSKDAAAFAAIGVVAIDAFIVNRLLDSDDLQSQNICAAVAFGGLMLGMMRYLCSSSPRLHTRNLACLPRIEENSFSRTNGCLSFLGGIAAAVLGLLSVKATRANHYAEQAEGMAWGALNHLVIGALIPMLVDYLRELKGAYRIDQVMAVVMPPAHVVDGQVYEYPFPVWGRQFPEARMVDWMLAVPVGVALTRTQPIPSAPPASPVVASAPPLTPTSVAVSVGAGLEVVPEDDGEEAGSVLNPESPSMLR